ncbi:MAG: helix-turn-helix domain-containing protein [Candidatus Dormibacteria bacterium]|jgi:transcriptional regulator with XRE-family HTH domain
MQNQPTERHGRPASRDKLHSGDVTPRWAAQLRAQRKRLGLTQRELADLAGVAERTVIAVERGSDGVGLGTLRRILTVLGLGLTLTPGHGEITAGD